MSKSPYAFNRRDIRFDSGEAYCSAWLYQPEGVERPPVVVLGHGLGAIREMRLDAFSERFAAAGIASLAFTYRHFGDSGGQPRQVMSVKRQLADWEAALGFVKSCPDVDGSRIAIWGSSFGGGHAITVASRHSELRAAVSQCPFTDGLASAGALGVKGALRVVPVVLRDLVAKLLGRRPVMVPVAAAPGNPALMNAHDALAGYLDLMPEGMEFVNCVAARVIPEIARYRPGARPPTSRSRSCSVSARRTPSRPTTRPSPWRAGLRVARSSSMTPGTSTSTWATPSSNWWRIRPSS